MYVTDVVPWMYADEQTKANVGVRGVAQRIFAKSRDSNNRFDLFTNESKTSFILSPVLLKPKMRPGLVQKSTKAAVAPPQVAPPLLTTDVVLGVRPDSALLPCTMLQGTGSTTVPHAWILQISAPTPLPSSQVHCTNLLRQRLQRLSPRL